MMARGWWLVVGLALLLSVALRHSLLFLMALLLALIGGASWLWTRYCLAAVTYRRRFGTTRLFYGEETELHVEIVNAKPLPLAWLRAEDEFPADVQLLTGRLHRHHLPRRNLLINLLSLRWYERVTRHYRVVGARRGAFVFGPVEIASGDIFGLDTKREKLADTQLVLVYPRVVPLTALGLPAHHPFGDYKTRIRAMEDPLRLMGTREYRPGDSYRHIHWKASARQPFLQTKVFDPSAARPLAIFLNVNTFRFAWEGVDYDLQEFAITAAASIARDRWEQGDHVGLYVNSVTWPGGARISIRPAGHPEQFTRILEALARVVEYGRWAIEDLIAVESAALPFGTTVIVVTPLITDQLLRALVDLRRREHAVTLVALGEACLQTLVPGIQYYHIGGREAWHGLDSLALA